MRKTLSRRLVVFTTALAAGTLLLAGASLSGLWILSDTVTATVNEYEELRLVEGALQPVSNARLALLEHDLSGFQRGIDDARTQLDRFISFQATETFAEGAHQIREMSAEQPARAALDEADAIAQSTPGEVTAAQTRHLLELLDQAAGHIEALARATDVDILAARAKAQVRSSVVWVTAALLAIVALGVVHGVSVYRAVMSPLRRLRSSVREIASGRLDQRLALQGDEEFAELAGDFNHMVAELDTLYRTLEERVAVRSRELVRSERLAGVGFLAAGMAHEISTPLNIITGYAEMSQESVARLGDLPCAQDLRQNLSILCDEAYRCKSIIQQLLSLARRSEGERLRVFVSELADSVAAMLVGMEPYRDKQIVLNIRRERPLAVMGNPAELKQVLLNLAVNALEAVEPGAGRVRIDVERRGDWVHLTVADNGVGMTPEVLQKVFEPFFTQRGRGARGVGLGLSVSHAIVESHGGRIEAFSDGPGRGSRFVVALPAANGDQKHDADPGHARVEPARADR